MNFCLIFLPLVFFISTEVLANKGNEIKSIASGGFHNCALFENGRVKCWGYNGHGHLGLGDSEERGDGEGEMGKNLPFLDLGVKEKVIQLEQGLYHGCALFESRRVKCWGRNGLGQLGLEDGSSRGLKVNDMGENLPFLDLGTKKKINQLKVGAAHSCALFENGRVKCWGYNASGQLGLGDKNHRGSRPNEMGENLPFLYFATNKKVTQLALGGSHGCVLFESNQLKCWGRKYLRTTRNRKFQF